MTDDLTSPQGSEELVPTRIGYACAAELGIDLDNDFTIFCSVVFPPSASLAIIVDHARSIHDTLLPSIRAVAWCSNCLDTTIEHTGEAIVGGQFRESFRCRFCGRTTTIGFPRS
jgi:hypothetical protein